MEKQFFTFLSCDQSDTMAFCYYNVTLTSDIGSHKAGEKFGSVDLDYEKGVLHLYTDDKGLVYEEYTIAFQPPIFVQIKENK